MAGERPFAGDYPTESEARQALATQGFGDHADTIVTIPMDGSTGPLAQELTRCQSEHLMQNWPILFRAVVGAMLKETQQG